MSEGRKCFWTAVAAAALAAALAAGPVLADDGVATGMRVADAHGSMTSTGPTITLTTGTATGNSNADETAACTSAKSQAQTDANCSGTLSVDADCSCQLRVPPQEGDPSQYRCTVNWGCAVTTPAGQ